jgi:hypothetical protein
MKRGKVVVKKEDAFLTGDGLFGWSGVDVVIVYPPLDRHNDPILSKRKGNN